jgi:hypothetical protein
MAARTDQLAGLAGSQGLALLLRQLTDALQTSRPAEVMQNAVAVLDRQLKMINWYLDKGLYVQAMTSAREWIVSRVVCQAGGDLFQKQARNDAERLLNNDRKRLATAAIPRLENLRELWLEVRDVRNSLAHAGMSEKAPTANEVIEHVKKVCVQLGAFLGTNDATG